MINVRFTDFSTYVTSRIPGAVEQQKAISIALGVATARIIPALATGCAGESTHYDSIAVYGAMTVVSSFNEQVLVDVPLALETTRAFWMMRQNAANCCPATLVLPQGNGTFIERAFGMNQHANPKTIEFCNKNPEVLATLVNRITALLTVTE
jgi:hypothetical protein